MKRAFWLCGCAVFAALAGANAAEPETLKKEVYLNIMERAVGAYSPDRIEAFFRSVEQKGVYEHGFPRLAANLGVLLAHGRLNEKRDLFVRMMDLCAREMPVAIRRGNKYAGNDFAVREIVCALDEIIRSDALPKEKVDCWRAAFAPMVAEQIYTCQPKPGGKEAANWCVFGAASEQARLKCGFGGSRDYVERYVADQLRFFDGNGMYCDPGQPMVYDFVTRLQFAMILALGYEGPSRAQLEEAMLRSADATLAMQSVTGEIPYGGRSNQFLHNETFYAALCEFYASWFKARGDLAKARRFRAAAGRAVGALRYWTDRKDVRHVKNRYPVASGYGCEDYAYFDKYMVTMGSWAYLAFRFADESILPADAPEGDSTFVTSEKFHRVMVNVGDYTAQYDWNAQKGYDASGLGRFQRRGAPPMLGLASPFSRKPHYRIDVTNDADLAIGPMGWKAFALVRAEDGDCAFRCGDAEWRSRLTRDGLEMVLTGKGEQTISLPAFVTDGERMSRIAVGTNAVEIVFDGWVCRYETDGRLTDAGRVYGNRNGHYRRFDASGEGAVRVRASLRPFTLSPEEELKARLPEILARSAAHYRALDAAATPKMTIPERHKSYVPHSYRCAKRELDMSWVKYWTAGHFPGSLWYLYEATGDDFFRARAEAWTSLLAFNSKVTDNHDVGFIMNCSYGNARRLLKTDRFDSLLVETAGSLAQRYHEKLGLIRSWGEIAERKHFLVIPDNMMNLELLEIASEISGNPRYDKIARSHANVTLRNHFRADGGAYHVLDYGQWDGSVVEIRRGQGLSCTSTWSRGQSWAIYGYAMMYRFTKDPAYLSFSRKLADFAINHPNMPADGVPFWDYGAPGEERDSSAAAIMASGLLELAGFVGGDAGAAYRAFAVKQLLSLASREYFSENDEIGHFLLKHGVGNKPGLNEIDVPLDYGDYYFLEALVRFRR